MKEIKFLSPTSIKLYQEDKEQFALRYLIDDRPEKDPQTEPMSVGSAFDAYAKSHIHHRLNGNYGKDNEFEFKTIFEAQVEPHNRDFALVAGKDCFDKYLKCGALADLMLELNKALGPPRFEFKIEAQIEWSGFSVPLLGKPDIYFMNDQGIRVIYDFKVNGYCSQSNTSPKKGYTKCRDVRKLPNIEVSSHKEAMVLLYKGIPINVNTYLEKVDKTWADQLSIYSWVLGEAVDSVDVVFGIDQIVGPGCSRIASHRLRITPDYRIEFMRLIQQIWKEIKEGIFGEKTEETLKVLQGAVHTPLTY